VAFFHGTFQSIESLTGHGGCEGGGTFMGRVSRVEEG
jgi:hypothetical protein